MALRITPSRRASRHGSVTDLRLLCNLLQKMGLEPAEFLSGAGISHGVLTHPGINITRRQERQFQSLFAVATRDRPDIWVESARRNRYTAWGDFGMATITAPTLRHVRHLAETRGGGSGSYPVVGHDGWIAGLAIALDRDFTPGTPEFQFQVVRKTIAGVDLYNELWGSPFPFTHIKVPAEVATFELSLYVDVPIQYTDGPLLFVWPLEFDELPLPRGDELLHQQYVAQVDKAGRQSLLDGGMNEDVCEIMSQMPDTFSGLDAIASELGLSGRTLQRRLAEQGITFQTIRQNSRIRKAQWMLRTSNASISEIASSVGYMELSSFSHAFRRWVGESPRSYRRRHASDDICGKLA